MVEIPKPTLLNGTILSNGTSIELRFDLPMADPSGNIGAFATSPVRSIDNIALKAGDNMIIILTVTTPIC